MIFENEVLYRAKSGVYSISSPMSEKVYVGSSNELSNRFCHHRLKLQNLKSSKKLNDFAKLVGFDTIVFKVIELCDVEKLQEREQFHIDLAGINILNHMVKVNRNNSIFNGGSGGRSERVYMPITSCQMKVVKKLMAQENRSKAQIVAMIFDDGLKLVEVATAPEDSEIL